MYLYFTCVHTCTQPLMSCKTTDWMIHNVAENKYCKCHCNAVYSIQVAQGHQRTKTNHSLMQLMFLLYQQK